MFSASEYQLVDFGAGRKLERFGPYLVDRPAPAAAGAAAADPAVWSGGRGPLRSRAPGPRDSWTTAAEIAGRLGPFAGGNSCSS